MNVVKLSIKAVDYDISIGDKPLKERIPEITGFEKQEVIKYSQQTHLGFYIECFNSFLKSNGFTDEAIVESLDEWCECKFEELGYDNK